LQLVCKYSNSNYSVKYSNTAPDERENHWLLTLAAALITSRTYRSQSFPLFPVPEKETQSIFNRLLH